MCGIAGFIGKTPPSETKIRRTLELMKNRGPDHQQAASFSLANSEIRLLHSRLGIIDLDPRSNQPFTIDNTTIVFNGEIYNYVELRQQLLKRGVELKTTSDTEVLLHYYRKFGQACVDHFEGMWAFAIWDQNLGEMFLSRDRFGEKPLYCFETADGLYFGSEIKFLKSLSGRSFPLNHLHLLRNLVHGYKSLYKGDQSYFDGVWELRYAENMTVDSAGRRTTSRYWTPTCEVDSAMSMDEAIEGVRHHLLESVRLRLRSDVPLAFCLSGGVDSAALASIAVKHFGAQIKTFSIIDDDERYNEEPNIRATINDLGCEHELIRIPQDGALPRLMKLIEYHDVPIATISYYVHSLISEAIHDGGYRVTFSGTSADELFTGYYDHFLLHLHEVEDQPEYGRHLSDWESKIAPFIRNPILRNPNLYDNPEFRDHIFDGSSEIRNYLKIGFDEPYQEHSFTTDLLRNRMLNELFHETTPVILHEDDLNSMLYSVENRSPYLDTQLFTFAYTIPTEHLIQDGYGKYVLRQALDGILNDQVRHDRKKMGFNASINSMIDFEDSEVRDFLLDPSAEIFQIVDRGAVKCLLNQRPMPNYLSKFLFNFVNARVFCESY